MAVALVGILNSQVFAQSAEQQLNDALAGMDNLTADFKQTVLDDNKQVVQQSSGNLAIQRPGKFAWIYTTPYEQQRWIARGLGRGLQFAPWPYRSDLHWPEE